MQVVSAIWAQLYQSTERRVIMGDFTFAHGTADPDAIIGIDHAGDIDLFRDVGIVKKCEGSKVVGD